MLRQFRANVIWIDTFWLQCHISIFLTIIKLKNILPLVQGPVRRFRIAPVSKCASSLSRFRAWHAQKIIRGRRRLYVTSRRIFVVRATSNGILGPDDEESLSSGRHRAHPKTLKFSAVWRGLRCPWRLICCILFIYLCHSQQVSTPLYRDYRFLRAAVRLRMNREPIPEPVVLGFEPGTMASKRVTTELTRLACM